MAKIYYDRDANLNLLKRKVIGIIGFGSQGHAHAQNLRDAGCEVIVGALPSGRSWKAAKKARFEVATAADVAKKANIVVMLAPDTAQPGIYRESIEREMTRGKTLMFAHGFSIHFSQIMPPAGVEVSGTYAQKALH
jgi:ketol-acid reductoisomerase